MKTYLEPAKELPVREEVDVLVVGAGPAGIMAAQAAALVKGTKVMLIDSRGYLGGNMTIGLPLLGFLGRKGNEIIKGLPLRFVERLRERGQATHHRKCPLHVSLTMVDPEGTKHLAWEIMEECGVEVLLDVFATDVIMVASCPVDLHHPVGGDCSLWWCPDCYDVPYRCLIPKKVDGVIAAGRDISATHLALASVRVMGLAMCLGEAAGKAAALAVRDFLGKITKDIYIIHRRCSHQ